MKASRCLILVLLTAVSIMSCGGAAWEPIADYSVDKTLVWDGNDKTWKNNLVSGSYRLADELVYDLGRHLKGDEVDGPILVASFVNIDSLEESSIAGRLMAEQVASRLAQHGLRVIEIKLGQFSIFVKKEKGEFLLSRDIKEISATNKAVAVVVGTYGLTQNRVYVTARVIRAADGVILASSDVGMPIYGAKDMDIFNSGLRKPSYMKP